MTTFKKTTLRVQSVIYQNERESILKAIAHLANAVRVEHQKGRLLENVTLVYGDASPVPIFTDTEIEQIQSKYKEWIHFQYRVFGFNTGSAKGHNLLAEDCKEEYMMIMNPDVIMSPRTLIELLTPFKDEKVGMTEARQSPIEHQKEYDIQTKETEWATTACAVFPTRIFRELNGFDSDTFFLYCDDLDFSWRLRLLGYKIIYQPLAPVYHAKRLSAKGAWKPGKAERYYSAEAALLIAHKWSNPAHEALLLRIYTESADEEQRKAAEKFRKMEKEGKLPEPLDPEHKIARFVDFYYTENRYIL